MNDDDNMMMESRGGGKRRKDCWAQSFSKEKSKSVFTKPQMTSGISKQFNVEAIDNICGKKPMKKKLTKLMLCKQGTIDKPITKIK